MRERLKSEFDTTLPRFDVMAALYRKPSGMLMSDLSRYLLVSNGNVTGIIDRLVTDGHVARAQREGDRRTSIVSLTHAGTIVFEKMAAAHESWIGELLGDIARRGGVPVRPWPGGKAPPGAEPHDALLERRPAWRIGSVRFSLVVGLSRFRIVAIRGLIARARLSLL